MVGYSVGLLAVAAPWIWWTARHASEPIVDPFYSASNYASWNIVFNYAWPDKLAVLEVNSLWAIQVGQYAGAPSRQHDRMDCCHRLRSLHRPWVVDRAGVRRSRSPALSVNAGLVMAWAFPPVRFLVPILPFLRVVHFRRAPVTLRPAVGVLAAVCVATSSVATWQLAQATQQSAAATWSDAGWRRRLARHQRFVPLGGRRTLLGDAVLIATHDPTGYLLTGRTAVRPDSMDPLMLYYNVSGRPVRTPTLSTWRSVSACSASTRITSSSPHAIRSTRSIGCPHVFPEASRSSRAT